MRGKGFEYQEAESDYLRTTDDLSVPEFDDRYYRSLYLLGMVNQMWFNTVTIPPHRRRKSRTDPGAQRNESLTKPLDAILSPPPISPDQEPFLTPEQQQAREFQALLVEICRLSEGMQKDDEDEVMGAKDLELMRKRRNRAQKQLALADRFFEIGQRIRDDALYAEEQAMHSAFVLIRIARKLAVVGGAFEALLKPILDIGQKMNENFKIDPSLFWIPKKK